jgi:hypothetical protein
MKKLLLFWIFSGSLDGFSQTSLNAICYHNTPACKCSSGDVVLMDVAKPDTIPATLLITHKPPSFGHATNGYCVYQGGVCTGKHLRYWHKTWVVVGPEYDVWRCKRRVFTPNK